MRIGYLPQEFELDPKLTVRENIEAGAVDLMDWLHRYQSGAGSETENAALLNQIESVDGWNFQARLKAEASALAAPPLDALVELDGAWRRGEGERALDGLRSAAGYLRTLCAKVLTTRSVPELHFELDRGLEHANRINELLEGLRRESGG